MDEQQLTKDFPTENTESERAALEMRERQRQRFAEWLDDKWPIEERRCPICSKGPWTITDIQEVRQFDGGNLNLVAPLIPVIGAACQNCGYIHWFNAIVAQAILRTDEIPGRPIPQQTPQDSQ